jgi:alpha-mannosidase
VLRIYNASPHAREAHVRLQLPGVGPLEAVDLAERPRADVALQSDRDGARIQLRPWQILTLRPR